MRITRERVSVEPCATSANLGPGFDSLGLALELRDRYTLDVTTGPTEVLIRGEGAGELPEDDTNLVVRTLRESLELVGAPQIGVRLTCTNAIPQGRGLGSSAAAIVGGIALARAILQDPSAIDDQAMLEIATSIEGHPDNVAPAIFGGVCLGYMEGENAHAVRLRVANAVDGRPALRPLIISPSSALSTATARAILSPEVRRSDATHNIARAALFVHALAEDPARLFAATADRLHQDARSSHMPQSVGLVHVLRSQGVPAVISGAGPTVLIPVDAPSDIARTVSEVVEDPDDWRLARVPLAQEGIRTVLS
ncbi:homoserine kinase [Dermabacter sp. p3-SID358]|uniref:homoserine kinase n=1 Tax=Dermabacter sp. p3-SID358 TaxID=2916114 RepID=UPI0021A6AE69|nr:homoserine kinase [Dermabacter sp. p3-SID358]MCT1866465.1 homoserine kinase [Dermabacter sp. p3-SID358]